ncbi:14-3-3 protein 1-like [Prosopis cineraria]|uniref:14-3-3 protein 1-like n=1 Tax=Prosopis cineraria TaxID=364024 RepID=UPI00240F339D|nr:14-3-3 protein 1-like [Prosopis cineraria]
MALSPENLTRDQCLYVAKLAEQAERFEEMVTFMRNIVLRSTPSSELTVEERNLVFIAYKNLSGSLRSSWRALCSIEQKEEAHKNDDLVPLVKNFRSEIESELSKVGDSILKLLRSYLIPSASTSESMVFYLKMKGDYHRYMAEFRVGREGKAAADDAMSAYKAAQDIANADLSTTHPVRLGLALNFSVFHYEILQQSTKAYEMANQAFEDAMSELDTMKEEHCKESTNIMQLLKDNVTYWTTDSQDLDDL